MIISKKAFNLIIEQFEARIQAEKSISAILQMQINMLQEKVEELKNREPELITPSRTDSLTLEGISTLFEEKADIEAFTNQRDRRETEEPV